METLFNISHQIIPQVEFDKLQTLTKEEIEAIKRKGSVLVKNVVDDAQAIQWREDLKKYVKTNPVVGEQLFRYRVLKHARNDHNSRLA